MLIFYQFCNNRTIAAIRQRGLAKYLPEFGWKPIVLSATSPKTGFNYNSVNGIQIYSIPFEDRIARFKRYLRFRQDITIHENLKMKTKKNRVDIIYIFKNLLIDVLAYPDPEIDWYKPAIKLADNIFCNSHIDAIISSSYPVTSHLIAKFLKEKYEIPWIADMRDLWTQNHYFKRSYIRRCLERKLEIKTLSKSDAIVTVSEPLAQNLKLLHSHKNVYTITNGFNPDEISKTPLNLLSPKFNIIYSGYLYGGKRDPEPLFLAIKQLIAKGVIDPKDIEIDFYGPKTGGWLEDSIHKYGLDNLINIRGFIPREEVLKAQRTAQILLLLTWNDPNERGVYTGKVFEYLAAKRPILSVGIRGSVVEDLLADVNAGTHVSTVEEIEQVLENWYRSYKNLGYIPYEGIESNLEKYSHREMARKFANILNEICD